MLPIKMMKVDPMARMSGIAAELARPQTRLRKVEEIWIEEAEDKRKADQYDQRPKLREPALRRRYAEGRRDPAEICFALERDRPR